MDIQSIPYFFRNKNRVNFNTLFNNRKIYFKTVRGGKFFENYTFSKYASNLF